MALSKLFVFSSKVNKEWRKSRLQEKEAQEMENKQIGKTTNKQLSIKHNKNNSSYFPK